MGTRGIAGPLRGKITDIYVELLSTQATTALTSTNIQAVEALNFVFWGKDSHASWVYGEESFSENEVISLPNGGITAVAHLGGLDIPYTDLDDTAEWHITVNNSSATDALEANTATFAFEFVPEYPA